MEELIEALTILSKYHDGGHDVTQCKDDELRVWGIDGSRISLDDRSRLDELGFFQTEEGGETCFLSFRFGGC